MAGKYDPMSGEMIRSHVTDAPISKDSILYPIADFLILYQFHLQNM